MTSISQKIKPVEKSKKDVRDTVLTNIVKMLTERKMLDKSKLEENIKKLTSQVFDSPVYNIKLDKSSDESKIVYIKLISQKITAINKSSNIGNFLRTYKKDINIVIVTSVGTKARQFIKANYKNTEIFTEEDMMINLIDHELIPKHEVLSKEETEEFYKVYNMKKRTMPKLFTGDPVAKYYNMKSNDVVRITRSSETAGKAIFYRLVIKGELK